MLLCIVMVTIFTRVYYFASSILFPDDIDILLVSIDTNTVKQTTVHKLKLINGKTISALALMDYSNNNVRRLIHTLKYTGDARVSTFLAQLLGDYLIQELSDIFSIYPDRSLHIVPVPLSRSRRKERGFSQLELLLDSLKSQYGEFDGHINYDLLSKTKDTLPQTTLSKKERLQNLQGAFKVRKDLVRGAHIILVDDVLTTGSTVAEVSKELLAAGAATVEVVTLAYTN